MELYLLRHGANFSKEIDPNQPLSPLGAEQAATAGTALAKWGARFDAVVASPKKRAEQTAQIVAKKTGFPEEAILVTDLVLPTAVPDKAAIFLKGFEKRKAVLVCSHLPFLPNLVSHLTGDGASLRLALDNGGLACLDLPEVGPGLGVLRWLLTPMQVRFLARG